jgi:hypothetical protein
MTDIHTEILNNISIILFDVVISKSESTPDHSKLFNEIRSFNMDEFKKNKKKSKKNTD